MFEKGVSGNPAGRPKGRKTLLRAAFVLAEKGISPADELVKIAQDPGTSVAMRVELWKFLQAYVEAPQTKPADVAPESPEESVENARKMADRLAVLSKPLDPPSANGTAPQP